MLTLGLVHLSSQWMWMLPHCVPMSVDDCRPQCVVTHRSLVILTVKISFPDVTSTSYDCKSEADQWKLVAVLGQILKEVDFNVHVEDAASCTVTEVSFT